jgi:PAS domain S-box-containing protein
MSSKSTLTQKQREELNLSVSLGYTLAIALVLFWYIDNLLQPGDESQAYLWQRLVLSALIVLSIIAFTRLQVLVPFFPQAALFWCFVVGSRHLFFFGISGYSFGHTLELILVIMSFPYIFFKLSHVRIFILYMFAGATISAILVHQRGIPPIAIVFCAGIPGLVALTGTRIRFKILSDIEQAHANTTALIENTEDPIWSIDKNYNYVAFNSSFARFSKSVTGVAPVMGAHSIMNLHHRELSKKLEEVYKDGMAGISRTNEDAFIINGEIHHFHSQSKPIKLVNGKIIGVTVFAHNITTIKLAELEIQQKNTEITASINYALGIQSAILPDRKVIFPEFDDHFIIYRPKDIVSGDFYWIEKSGSKILIAAADCTGHGVPGAMLSMIGTSALNRCVHEFRLTTPSLMLDKLNELLEQTFQKSMRTINDGMDIVLCSIDLTTRRMEFAAANNPLWIYRKNTAEVEFIELLGDKQPIGYFEQRKPFTNQTLLLEKGDMLYLFSDGLPDQFGGPRGKKFKYHRLQDALYILNHEKAEAQHQKLHDIYDEWKGTHEQIDDVMLIGIRV